MAVHYNLTALAQSQNIGGLFNYANLVTDNLFSLLIILAVCIIITLRLKGKGYDWIKCITPASFVSFVLSTIMTYFNWISLYYTLGFLLLFCVMAFMLFVDDKLY